MSQVRSVKGSSFGYVQRRTAAFHGSSLPWCAAAVALVSERGYRGAWRCFESAACRCAQLLWRYNKEAVALRIAFFTSARPGGATHTVLMRDVPGLPYGTIAARIEDTLLRFLPGFIKRRIVVRSLPCAEILPPTLKELQLKTLILCSACTTPTKGHKGHAFTGEDYFAWGGQLSAFGWRCLINAYIPLKISCSWMQDAASRAQHLVTKAVDTALDAPARATAADASVHGSPVQGIVSGDDGKEPQLLRSAIPASVDHLSRGPTDVLPERVTSSCHCCRQPWNI